MELDNTQYYLKRTVFESENHPVELIAVTKEINKGPNHSFVILGSSIKETPLKKLQRYEEVFQ